MNWDEFQLDTVAQWSNRKKMLLLLVLFFLVLLVGYWLMMKPECAEQHRLVAEDNQLALAFAKKQQQLTQARGDKAQRCELAAKFHEQQQLLASQDQLPMLLDDLSKIGVARGLTFELFAPLRAKTSGFLIELPINLVVVGDYHQLVLFLREIANMKRLVTLHDFVMTSYWGATPTRSYLVENGLKKTSKKMMELLMMKMMLKVYWEYEPSQLNE